jgi:RNA polymerase sigma factor (sigma-70 family)
MDDTISPGAQWPEHLLRSCERLGPGGGATNHASEAARTEAWVALRDALARFLRGKARRFGGISAEDLEDLASAKALDLVARAESGEWTLEDRSGGELAGYLATVAHHALIDHAKRARRTVSQTDLGDNMDPDILTLSSAAAAAATTTDAPALAREFIGSLRACLVQLQPRARRVWFFRVFYGMSSKAIAEHPEVMLRTAHIDVLMQRTRTAIRACMEGKGFEPSDMPSGTFVEVWEFLESLRDEAAAGSELKAEVP